MVWCGVVAPLVAGPRRQASFSRWCGSRHAWLVTTYQGFLVRVSSRATIPANQELPNVQDQYYKILSSIELYSLILYESYLPVSHGISSTRTFE